MIQGTFRDFHEGKKLEVDIQLEEPDMDTMVIATPFDRKHAFYYNQKINCMRASGTITYGEETFTLHPDTDFGTLDWGRGVWTYDNTWYWGSGNGYAEGCVFGFNIGHGFGNTKAATENVIFCNGKAHKLDDVEIRIPGDVSLYDMKSPKYMEPWEIHESGGRFEKCTTNTEKMAERKRNSMPALETRPESCSVFLYAHSVSVYRSKRRIIRFFVRVKGCSRSGRLK